MKLTFLINEVETKVWVGCLLHHGLFIIDMAIEYLIKDKTPEKQKMKKKKQNPRTAEVQEDDNELN